MRERIAHYYLKPESKTYRFFHFIHHEIYLITIGIIALLLAYPISQLSQQLIKRQDMQQKIVNIKQEIQRHQQLLTQLENEQKTLTDNDQSIAMINQQLNAIFEKNDTAIETIQWNLEQDKSVTITATQQAGKLFTILQELTLMNNIKFKEINMLKTNKNRSVKLIIILSF